MSGCIPIQGGYICGTTSRYQRQHGKCYGLCGEENARIVVAEGSPYYAPIVYCVDCGDSWSDGELGERPFARGWRKRAIERNQRMWDAGCECRIERNKDYYPLPCSKHSPKEKP